MSATGRGGKRNPFDFYATPAGITQRIVRHLGLPGGKWLEPAAGDGAIIRAITSIREDIFWTACELRAECADALRFAGADEVLLGDFRPQALLLAAEGRRFDVAILNPPFKLAQTILGQCLELCDWVVALERVNWLASLGRENWMRTHTPDVYLLPDRPSFSGGTTDSIEYAWMVWRPGDHKRDHGRVEILPSAPGQSDLFQAA